MKGDTVTLLYNLLLELDKYYFKPIKELDEVMIKKRVENHVISSDLGSRI